MRGGREAGRCRAGRREAEVPACGACCWSGSVAGAVAELANLVHPTYCGGGGGAHHIYMRVRVCACGQAQCVYSHLLHGLESIVPKAISLMPAWPEVAPASPPQAAAGGTHRTACMYVHAQMHCTCAVCGV